MAETPDRRVDQERGSDTSPSATDVRAAIWETRARLTTGLTRTAEHLHTVYIAPSSAQSEGRDGGFVGGAVHAIALAGRSRRAWTNAKKTGIFRRAAIGAATVALAAVLATKRRRPRRISTK
jgi:hypothetical protein